MAEFKDQVLDILEEVCENDLIETINKKINNDFWIRFEDNSKKGVDSLVFISVRSLGFETAANNASAIQSKNAISFFE